MRYGIITDVHANDKALKAVFKHAENMKIKSWWFLGDAVGYGPSPFETIRMLKNMVLSDQWRIGNHDAMLVGLEPLTNANEDARWTIEKHQEILQQQDEELWRWCLKNWGEEKIQAVDVCFPKLHPKLHIWFAHAALEIYRKSDPIELYLLPWPNANGEDYKDEVFEKLSSFKEPGRTNLLIHGHTHVPCAMGIRKKQKNKEYLPIHYDVKLPIRLDEFDVLIINPGSVGLPRNADIEPHADYGVLDTSKQTFQFCRVPYNDYKEVEQVIYKMYQQDYPEEYRLLLKGANTENPLYNRPQKVWEWLEWNRRYKWNGNGWDVISQE